MDYSQLSNDELLVILSEVATELNSRAIGIADHGGKTLPVIEQQGNIATCVHIGSDLSVSVFKESLQNMKVVPVEKGQLTSRTSLSKFIQPKQDGRNNDQQGTA